MTPDLTTFVGPLLVIAGILLQFFLRQFSKLSLGGFSYWGIVLGLCVTVYALTIDNPFEGGIRYGIINFLLWVVGASATVRGGSSATDALAKFAVQKNPELAGNPLVPKTGSL